MNSFLSLLIRHGAAALAAYLAAHGFAMDGGPTTASLIVGLCIMGVASVWSWLSKMLKLDYDVDVYNSTALRTALGSLISQGITFASAYYAVDANDPAALGIAALNAVASHYGLHQQIAHQTPVEKASAIRAAALCLMLTGLVSCAGLTTWLATPAGRATVSLAELGLDVAAAKGKISPGQVVNVKQGIAVVTDPGDSTVSKVFKLEDLGIKAAVQTGKLQPGDAVIIQQASAIVQSAVQPPEPPVQPSGKAPASVVPAP